MAWRRTSAPLGGGMLRRLLLLLLILMALATPPPSLGRVEQWVVISQPTEVYSEDGALAWVAQPGERYRYIETDDTGGWFHLGSEELAYWLAADERADRGFIDASPPPPPATPGGDP